MKILLATLMTAGQALLALPQSFIDHEIVTTARTDLSYLRANPDVEIAGNFFANSMDHVLSALDGVDLSASDDEWRDAYHQAVLANTAYFTKLERQVRHRAAILTAKREGAERRAARKAEKAIAHQALIDGQKAAGIARRDERIQAHNDRNASLKKAA